MSDPGYVRGQARQELERVGVGDYLGLDARGCEEQIGQQVLRIGEDQAGRCQAVLFLVLDDRTYPIAPRLQRADQVFRLVVGAHGHGHVDIAGRPRLGASADGQAADEGPAHPERVQIAGEASARTRGRSPVRPGPQPPRRVAGFPARPLQTPRGDRRLDFPGARGGTCPPQSLPQYAFRHLEKLQRDAEAARRGQGHFSPAVIPLHAQRIASPARREQCGAGRRRCARSPSDAVRRHDGDARHALCAGGSPGTGRA